MILSQRDSFYLSYKFVHQNYYLNKLKKKKQLKNDPVKVFILQIFGKSTYTDQIFILT